MNFLTKAIIGIILLYLLIGVITFFAFGYDDPFYILYWPKEAYEGYLMHLAENTG
jgi:hypothetical protein